MVSIKAHFDGKTLVPDEPLNLTPGQRLLVRIEADVAHEPQGVPGSSLLRFAGTMTPADAAEMMRAIDEGCGKVDDDGW